MSVSDDQCWWVGYFPEELLVVVSGFLLAPVPGEYVFTVCCYEEALLVFLFPVTEVGAIDEELVVRCWGVWLWWGDQPAPGELFCQGGAVLVVEVGVELKRAVAEDPGDEGGEGFLVGGVGVGVRG